MRILGNGATRTVILTRRWAIKVPGAWTSYPRLWWSSLLGGLLANIREARRSSEPGVCPPALAIPGGWLSVYPRADPVTREAWIEMGDAAPTHAEGKPENFGFVAGRLVAIDYGEHRCWRCST